MTVGDEVSHICHFSLIILSSIFQMYFSIKPSQNSFLILSTLKEYSRSLFIETS